MSARVQKVMTASAFLAAVISATLTAGGAQAATLATWTFETNTPANLTGAVYTNSIAADIGSGNATGAHASAATAWSSPAGNGSTHSFSSNNWSVGDYYQFSVNTTGYNGITVSWDQTSSSTGPRDFKFAYSIDGVTFSDFATYSAAVNGSPNAAWNGTTSSAVYSLSQNLAAITALNNQSQIFFRIIDNGSIAENGNAVASAGTDRIDNFSVSGIAAVPVPGAAWLMASGLLGMAGIARQRKSA